MSAFVRIETAGSPEALLEALHGTLAWLGDDELGLAFVRWVSDVLMPLRFPEADRELIEDLKQGMTMLAERAKQWTEQWFAEGRETGLREGLEQGPSPRSSCRSRSAGPRMDTTWIWPSPG